MTEPHDELGTALRRLRGEVRDLAAGPSAARLRVRARRQRRVRQLAAVALAAGVVAVIAVGGNAVLRPVASDPPPPPAVSSPPTTAPPPTSAPPPDPPRVTPSPRPAPRTPAALDDPIVEVDWRQATITIPPREGSDPGLCPSGPVTFAPVSDISTSALGPENEFPAILLGTDQIAYGDLTGDGRAEAVLEASCHRDEDGLASGHGWQLLVVRRDPAGTLVGLGWTAPPGAYNVAWWVAGGRLLVDADPWASPENDFPAVPGLALAYEWDGSRFVGWQPAPEYPPMVPLAAGEPGPPVLPRAVAGGLGCPDLELRFVRSGSGWDGSAAAGDSTYTIPAGMFQQYLFDLDRTGDRLLVTALQCLRPDGSTGYGLAVFERAGTGWQGISALVAPAGLAPGWWRADGGELVVAWSPVADGGQGMEFRYRWTGTVLEPVRG